MGFRITTNMMMNSYRHNLMNSTNKLADARDKVLTQRNFNSYAEDPTGATKAFRLRRDWYQTNSQLTNTTDTYNKFHTAWTNIQGILKDLENPLAKMASINGTTGTAGESRKALAQILRDSADSLVHSMNQQLGDQFIFGGKDGLNVPFTWSEDGRTLLYRGVNVDAGGVEKPASTPPTWLDDAKAAGQAAGTWDDNDEAWFSYYAGTSEKIPNSDTMPKWAKDMLKQTPNNADESAWMEYYRDRDDVAKLKTMSEEEMYIDLGMGFQEDGRGDMITSSAFDSALPGIGALGFGVDKDGLPNNLVTVIKQLGQIFSRCTTNEGDYATDGKTLNESYATDGDYQTMLKLMDKYKQCMSDFNNSYTELDSKATYLRTNLERLETEKVTLNEQILDVEQIDLADAITAFSWDQFCYNSALKVGNQLLSQSLLDYMG